MEEKKPFIVNVIVLLLRLRVALRMVASLHGRDLSDLEQMPDWFPQPICRIGSGNPPYHLSGEINLVQAKRKDALIVLQNVNEQEFSCRKSWFVYMF